MARAVVVKRIAVLWLLLALFGIAPGAVLLVVVDAEPVGVDAFVVPTAEANGRAQLIDAHLRRWLAQCEAISVEVSGLMEQLPDGPLGTAAEGTLMGHLQRRLAGQLAPEVGELSVAAPGGRTLLSTDGTRIGAVDPAGNPEIAQAARRPAAALLASETGGELVVAAPVRVRGELRAIVVARIRPEAATKLMRPSTGAVRLTLFDANGVALADKSPVRARREGPKARRAPERSDQFHRGLAELGGESSSGTRWVDGHPVAFAPLARARLVVVASGSREVEESSPWTERIVLGGGVMILLLAGLVSWFLGRSP